MDIHSDFNNNKVVYNLFVCYVAECNKIAGRRIINGPAPTVGTTGGRRKKRSRGEWEGEQNDNFFLEIYDIMKNEDVWSTFMTLVGTKIRQQLANTNRESNSYYGQVTNIVVDFKIAMMRAEELYNGGFKEDFYYYILDDIGKMLKLSKHQVLYFQLELNSSN